ncbi:MULTISPECIES: YsgD/CorL family protein [Atlantibacter]
MDTPSRCWLTVLFNRNNS